MSRCRGAQLRQRSDCKEIVRTGVKRFTSCTAEVPPEHNVRPNRPRSASASLKEAIMNKMMKLGMVVIATGLVGISATGATSAVTSSVANPQTSYQTTHFPIGPCPNPYSGH